MDWAGLRMSSRLQEGVWGCPRGSTKHRLAGFLIPSRAGEFPCSTWETGWLFFTGIQRALASGTARTQQVSYLFARPVLPWVLNTLPGSLGLPPPVKEVWYLPQCLWVVRVGRTLRGGTEGQQDAYLGLLQCGGERPWEVSHACLPYMGTSRPGWRTATAGQLGLGLTYFPVVHGTCSLCGGSTYVSALQREASPHLVPPVDTLGVVPE